MITFINGEVYADGLSQHCFIKQNRVVVVQSSFLPHQKRHLSDRVSDTSDVWEYTQRHQKAVYETLELIQPLLDSIDFNGSRNWVFLNQVAGGSFNLMQKRKSFKHLITCPLDFAPRIYERDLEIVGWNAMLHAKGYYRGKSADIWYGWDAKRMEQVNRAMLAARHLQGADFIQEVYGILMDDEDEVLGLVVEATRGRALRGLEDYVSVYHAVSELEKRRCLFHGFDMGFLLIADGKARFSDLRQITVFSASDQAEFDRQRQVRHWEALDNVFADLEEGNGIFPHFNFVVSQPVIVLFSFAPEKPISPLTTHFFFWLRSLSDIVGDSDEEYHSIDRPLLAGTTADILRPLRVFEDLTGASMELYDNAARLRIRALKHAARASIQLSRAKRTQNPSTQRRARRNATTAPYYRNITSRTATTPVGYPYDSDCTSESGQSRFEEIF
ncbi:hypothetical protein NMY22_g3546 [Coprinellus aureogranulatus]|nr:hypothetical protein NMY22_g3546 [Coprinellus aureogranulatus]